MIPDDKIRNAARALRDYTAENLAQMIRIPSLSGEEGPVIEAIAEMARNAGFDEVRVDGLGNLIARVGHGPRVLAIDAHIDTVDTGDLSQWDHDPFSGLIEDDELYLEILKKAIEEGSVSKKSINTIVKIIKGINQPLRILHIIREHISERYLENLAKREGRQITSKKEVILSEAFK